MYQRIAYIRRGWVVVAAIVAVGTVTGCAQPAKDTPAQVNDHPITKTAEDGPVALTLTLATDKLTINQRVRLSVSVSADRNVTIHTDDYLAALLEDDRRFELGATLTGKKEAAPDEHEKLTWQYDYEVTCFLPGEIEFPGASVSFTKSASNGNPTVSQDEPETVTLSTEPIQVVVADARKEPLSPAEMVDIGMPDPVELHRPVSLVVWAGIICAALAVGLVAYSLRRRRGESVTAPPIPAHIWARLQLDTLAADDLPAKGQMQEFYYRVSGIVRGYVERRFFVSAPEMTTEEFLLTSRDDPRFAGATATSLGSFLTACDLVKYARHEPTSQETEQAISAAEAFIEQTRVRDEPNDVAETAVTHDAHGGGTS